MRTATAVAAVATAVVVLLAVTAGCGEGSAGSGAPEPPGEPGTAGAAGGGLTEATLVLDYLPNGVHAGVYRALAAGYYEDAGIDLKVITPTSTADTLRFIQAGKADFGLADGIDLAGQISEGRDAKGIMALLQRPAGGLVTPAGSGVGDPGELAGKTVGVTGVPSDEAVFATMVEAAGGDPAASKVVTIGFNGVQSLLAGGVAAFTGYVPADATAIEAAGRPRGSTAIWPSAPSGHTGRCSVPPDRWGGSTDAGWPTSHGSWSGRT